MPVLTQKLKRSPMFRLCLCVLVLVAACIATVLWPSPAEVVVPAPSATPIPTPQPESTPSVESSQPVSSVVQTLQNEIAPTPRPYGRHKEENADSHILEVPFIDQSAYPTGCESVSAVMLLQYYHVSIDVDTFIDEYLETGEYREDYYAAYAPHPNDAFIGDPRSYEAYGCYSPVIYRAMEKCLPDFLHLLDETGSTLRDLCRRYIDLGHPVLVWATMEMMETSEGATWILPDGESTFTWVNNEHCLVLVGYDEENYYFNDPMCESAPTAYPRALAEQRYEELGMQALVVFP